MPRVVAASRRVVEVLRRGGAPPLCRMPGNNIIDPLLFSFRREILLSSTLWAARGPCHLHRPLFARWEAIGAWRRDTAQQR